MESAEKKFQTRATSVGGSNTRRDVINYAASKPIFVEDKPDDSFGVNGDTVFWENKQNFNKVEQFIKHQGSWINLSLGRPASNSQSVKVWVKAKAV